MNIHKAAIAAVIAVAAVPVGAAVVSTGVSAQNADPCYEQVTEVRYEKFVSGVINHGGSVVGESGWNRFYGQGAFGLEDYTGAGPLDWGDVPSPVSGGHNSVQRTEGHDGHTDTYRSTAYEYQVVDERFVNGEQIACTPQPPDDFDERSSDGTCDGPGDTTFTRTTYRTDFTYVLSLDDDPGTPEWVRTQVGDEYVTDSVEVETDACPLPPVPDAYVECISTGPDYVSWQLTNAGEVGITSPVALAPGESAVIESLFEVEGSVTITVEFADGTSADFVGSGEGCVFVPPVTTEPPTTALPPVTTLPDTTPPPATEPPVTITTLPPTIDTDPPVVVDTDPPTVTWVLPETL